MIERTELRNAAVGAIVTIVLSFTGFSALLGGGIAGSLQREPPKRGVRVGALSGGLASLPIVLILLVGFVLVLGQPSALGVGGALELVLVLFVMFPLLFAWLIGLSALGGYLGAYLRTASSSRRGEMASAEQG
jgi:hypothetical protein